jgi:GT2 family glycosyltransferase
MSSNATAPSHPDNKSTSAAQRQRFHSALPFPADLVLTPLARNPIQLETATWAAVLNRPGPDFVVTQDPSVAPVSIVVAAFNNLVFTRMCLESLLANTEYANYELLVVDNASTDGTRDYLHKLMTSRSRVRLLLNDSNLGFAAANNQALREVTGEYLVLLNNDTIVPRGWLSNLISHLDDAEIGLVGATTNRIGNEAEIETTYRTYGEFEQFVAQYTRPRIGAHFDIRTATMFCVALRRSLFEEVGPLDEQFGLGMFEDDDYSMRVRAAGLRVVCADDVFVHHFGQASFGKLAAGGLLGPLFHANRVRWEAKWGQDWVPHERRPNRQYQQLLQEIRKITRAVLPQNAVVLVASRGDAEILESGSFTAWHFPQTDAGTYAGHHPASSAEAIARLESLRAKGGQYLLFPRSAFWWLEYYVEFRQHLERRYHMLTRHTETCKIFDLSVDHSR